MGLRVKYAFGIAIVAALTWGMNNACYANFHFQIGNNPQPNEENVLFGQKETGNPITGATNKSNTSVSFSTTASYLLNQLSSGQADIEGLANNQEVNLTNITITPGVAVTDMILNPHNATRGTVATVTVNGLDKNGNAESQTFTYNIANGQNFATIWATDGETITSVTVDTGTTGSFQDLRHPRISGAAHAIPEPASLTLLGIGTIGLIGVGWRKRLRRA